MKCTSIHSRLKVHGHLCSRCFINLWYCNFIGYRSCHFTPWDRNEIAHMLASYTTNFGVDCTKSNVFLSSSPYSLHRLLLIKVFFFQKKLIIEYANKLFLEMNDEKFQDHSCLFHEMLFVAGSEKCIGIRICFTWNQMQTLPLLIRVKTRGIWN